MGISIAACTSATCSGELASVVISQAEVLSLIHEPISAAKLAVQSARNSR